MRSHRSSSPRTPVSPLRTLGPRTLLVAAAAAAVAATAPTGASAADRLSKPITGFTAGAAFTDVTLGADGHLWIAEPEPYTVQATTLGNLFEVSPDGVTTKTMHPTGTQALRPDGVSTTSTGLVPSHVTTATDGTIWFSGGTDHIGTFDTDGSTSSLTLDPKGPDGGGQIGELTPGDDGAIWFTEPNLGRIGEVTADGALTSFPVGVTPDRITTGPDHNVWFTVPDSDKIGRLSPTGAVSVFALPALPITDVLSAIASGGDGNLWVASSEVFMKIATDGSVQAAYSYTGYSASSRITDLAAGPDGNLWFTQTSPNVVGRVYPDGTFTSDSTKPFGDTLPSAIVRGPNSDLYYVGTQGTGLISDALGRVVPTVGPHSAVHAVTDATDTTATLTADVSADGADAGVHFEWGVTNAYGTSTPVQAVASGGHVPVSAALSGLRTGTIYHFRAVQTSALGSSVSGDYTFKTSGVPTGPTFPNAPSVPPAKKGATANDVGGALAVQVTKVKLAPSGVVRLPLVCSALTPCVGTVVVTGTIGKKKSVVLAQKKVTVTSGKTAKLGLRLSKAGVKAVRKAGKKGLSVLVTITVNGKKQRYRLTITR